MPGFILEDRDEANSMAFPDWEIESLLDIEEGLNLSKTAAIPTKIGYETSNPTVFVTIGKGGLKIWFKHDAGAWGEAHKQTFRRCAPPLPATFSWSKEVTADETRLVWRVTLNPPSDAPDRDDPASIYIRGIL